MVSPFDNLTCFYQECIEAGNFYMLSDGFERICPGGAPGILHGVGRLSAHLPRVRTLGMIAAA